MWLAHMISIKAGQRKDDKNDHSIPLMEELNITSTHFEITSQQFIRKETGMHFKLSAVS